MNKSWWIGSCLALVLSASLTLVGCAAGAPQILPGPPGGWGSNDEAASTPSSPTITPPSAGMPERPSGESDKEGSPGSGSLVDRMVVRSASVMIVVDDVSAATQTVAGLADTFGGYVISSSVYQDSGRIFGDVVIRVDASRFAGALSAIRALAVEVVSETTTSTDVTEEYVDLSARKRNLERTEQQLLALMEEAGTVEELLNVQREVSSVRGQIEQLEARIRYLEQTSAMSLIQVSLRESVLTVNFSADVRRVEEGEPVKFAAEVSGGFLPYSYSWDFGDGTTGNQDSPSHSYDDEGYYSVTLTVTDDRGATATYYRDYYIQVEGVWSPADVFGNAVKGLGSLGRATLSFVIWLIVYIPVWLVLGGIAYLLYRRAMRKHRTKDPS